MPNSNSQKQYLSTYLSLIKKSGSEDLKKIYEYIKDSKVKETTKLSYLNSIISLKKFDPKLIKGNLTEIKEYRDNLGMKIEKARENNNTNPRQAKAIEKVTLNNIKDFVKKLEENKKNGTKELENYILVKLMSDYPIRNDLQEILLTKIRKDLSQPVNSLYIPNKKGQEGLLSLKEYKTSKTNGDILIKIEPSLVDDIKQLIKDNRKYLFVNAKNEPLSSSSFTHKMNRIFEKEFGIPISSTILRKIYLTSKYGKINEEMIQDAKIMGHDVETQRKIYIKKKPTTESK